MAFNPPYALSAEGWDSFNREFKEKAAIRYWIHNDFRRRYVNPVRWKYRKLVDWIRYRTTDRYHVVKTGLEPGYAEKSEIMLYVNFTLLKDYVEVDLARRWLHTDEEKQSWYSKYVPSYHLFFPFRRPDLGIKYLEWASTLDDPTLPTYEQSPAQAEYAREVHILYKWWVDGRPGRVRLRPVRPQPIDVDNVGLFVNYDYNSDEYKEYEAELDMASAQQDEWHKEDNEMLIRLIKTRDGLWT